MKLSIFEREQRDLQGNANFKMVADRFAISQRKILAQKKLKCGDTTGGKLKRPLCLL
jgi:hypothetical protein